MNVHRERSYERVLVTGTSGFIASHLAAALSARGYRVLGVDVVDPPRPARHVEYIRCDLLEAESIATCLRDFAPEVVLHLAARTDLDETRAIQGYAVNFVGVENVLAAIRATASVKRAICTSSQLVCRMGYVPSHDQDFAPTTLYGESKVRTEQIWRRQDGAGTNWCLVRPTTIWGPWMNPHYVRFFRMIRTGSYRHVGRAATFKSYGFVGNTAAQFIGLLEAPASDIHRKVFFLADYEPIELRAWANAFQEALGAPHIPTIPLTIARAIARLGDLANWVGFKRFPFNSFRLDNVLTDFRLDLSGTRAVCGAIPYSTADGIAQTVDWLRTMWSNGSALSS